VTTDDIDRAEQALGEVIRECARHGADLGEMQAALMRWLDGDATESACVIDSDDTELLALADLTMRSYAVSYALTQIQAICTHATVSESAPECYARPVAWPEHPAAHGCIRVVETCLRCGARRAVNRNNGHREDGPWESTR